MPHRIAGPRLLPLNCLRESFPELYEVHLRKYAGREELLLDRVPGLECHWSDVLFMTAVPLLQIRELHEEAGMFHSILTGCPLSKAEIRSDAVMNPDIGLDVHSMVLLD